MLYGTGELKGVGDAFWRGAKTGALSSGFRNIEEALWPERSRDPKGMCGSPDPFELTQGFGNGRGYHSASAHGEGGFSLGGLVKDMVVGGIVGGLGSAGFYGAGKAVDALKSSVVGRRNSNDSTEIMYYYPSNNGIVVGTERKVYLLPGDKIDRYGTLQGKYFSPIGTPLEMRALPYNANITQYRQFEVVKPFEVEESIIKPWFGKIGLGTQYRSEVRAEILLKRGIIKLLGGN